MHELEKISMTRRSLLKAIGTTAGTGAMYQAMVEMGYAANSDFTGPINLSGAPKGASVLILGAGLAGMVAAKGARTDDGGFQRSIFGHAAKEQG